MNERVTLVSLFNKENSKKIIDLLERVEQPLCKVPYGKKLDDRIGVDTLPYHFTLFACSITKKDEMIEILDNWKFISFSVLVKSMEIIKGAEDSYELRFNIENNNHLYELQKFIYEKIPIRHYQPDEFHFHITIHCDKDYYKVLKMKEKLDSIFSPFTLQVDKFGLFEIYPANLVRELSSK